MKKIFSLALALVLALSLAACGGGSAPASTPNENSTASTPPASQSEAETAQGETGTTDNESLDDDTIAVKDVSRGYSGGSETAFIQINFGRPSFEKVQLEEVRDMDAAEAGFSTTGDFELLTISVFSNGVSIDFNGTEDNYDQIPDITYTQTATPVLKDADGTPLDSFSHEIPYRNLELFQ